MFKDITPVLADPSAFRAVTDGLATNFESRDIDVVLGVEARGFITAAPLAYRLGAGFVPARKAGKLPWEVERQSYELEYGSDALEVHRDGFAPGARVLVVDDVLATGGTALAAAQLVEALGGVLVGFGFLIELGFLAGRGRLDAAGQDRPAIADAELVSLVTYD